MLAKRNLGRSGLRVTLVGLGCNNFGGRVDLEASRKVVHKALDLGINLLDTADIYGNKGGSETCLGEILGDRRKDIVLASKFALPMDDSGTKQGASRRYIMAAIEDSLRRLKTDWIDLYQVHTTDPLTPMEETLRALDDLIRQGKVRYIGLSNHAAWRVVEAQHIARQNNLNAFISCQDEYSLLERRIERNLLHAMPAYGLGLLPYFPLAKGLLSGKYSRLTPKPEGARLTKAKETPSDATLGQVERLAAFAAKRGHSLLELAFSWLAAQPLVASVIAGATKPEQLEQNAHATGWTLTAAELAEIDTLTRPQ